MSVPPLRRRAAAAFAARQREICAALERFDGAGEFRTDRWEYRPGRGDHETGGGVTRVIENGAIFERAGVNFSDVGGTLSDAMATKLAVRTRDFHATGLSLVLHPRNPHVPTVHMNVRYLEIGEGESAWFGGGADLTPYYVDEDDIRHFHATWKRVCDRHAVADHAKYKRTCDAYFRNPHRDEARGVGGIFFDDEREKLEAVFRFTDDVAGSFLDAWLPIAARNRSREYTPAQREWQRIRRGRYVEFNLVWDRGTQFGLETGGRTESILMSLPPTVAWRYDHHPAPGSREAELVEILRSPRDWLARS